MPRTLYLLAAVLLFPPLVVSQTITASLDGTVQDASGAVVPGAKVRITQTATNAVVNVETGADGRYVAPALPAGPYAVQIEAAGFKTLHRTGIVLQVNQAARLDFVLELGAVTETVEVTGQAPLLDAANAAVGQVIENRSIVELPLNQRNPYSLILLAPGVSGSTGMTYNEVGFSVNGGRPGTNEILLDGIPSSPTAVQPVQVISVFPSVDAVQEFKVQTNNYSAEFGRSGGGIINLIYKSGTNQLHGSAFEFLRNSRLDANNFFANRRGIPLGSFKRNQFGASGGGPVYIPGKYDGRNRTFFFVAYEGLRERSASNLLTSVPTALQRAGDFSQTLNAQGQLIRIYDPETTRGTGAGFVREPFPANAIPASRFDPVARNVARYYPLPNGVGDPNTGRNNFAAAGTNPTTLNQLDTRGDQIINERHRLFLRVSWRNLNIGLPDYFPAEQLLAQGGMYQPQKSLGSAFDYTWTISPTFLTDFRAGFGRILLNFRPRSDGFDPTQLGLPAYIASNADRLMFPGFAPQGYFGLGNGGSDYRHNAFETYSVHLANTKVMPSHTLKFGFEMRLLRVNNFETGSASGNFTFDRSLTQGPDPNRATATAGDSFASLLLGLGSGGMMTKTFKDVATVSNYYGWYLADDWKATSRLTLNIGLRYELDLPRTERYNRMNYFDPLAPSPLAGPTGLAGLRGGLAFVGVDGRGPRQSPIDTNNWAPRIGFAYQATRKLVLRSAFGIFYAPSQMAAGGTVGNFGWRSDTEYFGTLDGVTPNNYLRNPFPNGLVPVPGSSLGLSSQIGSLVEAPLRDTVVPYSMSWNYDVQYELPKGILVEGSYVGQRGVKLNESHRDYNLNQLRPEQLALGSKLQERVPNPFFGQVTTGPLASATIPASFLMRAHPQFTVIYPLYKTGASSIYHALQIKAEKRFAAGLNLLLAYTAGKLIDDYSRTAVVGRTAAPQNIYDRKGERSVSLGDVPQRLVMSYVYELPFGRGRRLGAAWAPLLDAFAGGWQLNGITTFQSGQPLTLATQDTSNSGTNLLRPNSTGRSAKLEGPVVDRLNRYFDTSAFVQPAAFTFGNAGRALPDVRGPGVRNWDLSIFKNFRLMEGKKLQFRSELFNAFNTPQFDFPNSNLNNPLFGTISAQANTPRQIQFGLKLLF